MDPGKLTEKSRAILQAIAKGQTYEQILVQELAWTYHDIFEAATEALDLEAQAAPATNYEVRMTRIKTDYPNAYLPWTSDLDARLTAQFRSGATGEILAREFRRQPGSIRSRLAKLGLIGPNASH